VTTISATFAAGHGIARRDRLDREAAEDWRSAQGLDLRPTIAPLRRSRSTDADQQRATSRKDGNQVSEG